jgi:hypothetical protein
MIYIISSFMATNWSERTKPTTNWNGRQKPIIFAAPLQDSYRIVRDQNNEIIYIISNE